MSDAFDPDAYLAGGGTSDFAAATPPAPFNPDAYLANAPAPLVPKPVPAPVAFDPDAYLKGAAQPQTPPESAAPSGILATFGAEAARAAIGLPGEALKGIGVGLGSLDPSEPIESGAIYKMGDALTKYSEKWGATEASKEANPIAAHAGPVVGGAVGMAPALLASITGAPAAATLALATGTVAAFAAAGAGNTFSEALLKGADENTAAKAAGLNAIVAGGLGVLPLGAMLSPIRAYAPELVGWAANTLEKAVVAGVVFTSVGEAQEFLGRQIAQNFYDPEAGYQPNVYRVLGGLLGGGIIGTVTPRMIHNTKSETLLTDKVLQGVADQIIKDNPPPAAAAAAIAQATGEPVPKLRPATEAVTGLASPMPEEKGWRAYHGTAADFREFDPAKRGTGEGAASFGVGDVYVGEHINTGTDYQNRMASSRYEGQPFDASNPLHLASSLINKFGTREAAAQFADQEAAKGTIGPAFATSAKLYGEAAKVLGSEVPISKLERIGNLYTVEVTRPKEHFLEWDKPLNDQPKMLAVFKKLWAREDIGPPPVQGDPGAFPGKDHYSRLSTILGSPEEATRVLKEQGVAGNRYLDAGSRGAESRIPHLEGFIQDNLRAIQTARELLKTMTVENARTGLANTLAEIEAKNARYQQEIADIRSGKLLTYNAVVYDAADVKVTHRNGNPLGHGIQKIIEEIQRGTARIEDKGDGIAIINGREVGDIPADELKARFGKPDNDNVVDLAAERKRRDNGYAVNERAMAQKGVNDFPDTPVTETTATAREATKQLFGGKPPAEAEAMATAADHYYRRLRYLIGLRELLAANPQNKPLQDYGIHLDHMLRHAAERLTAAEDTIKLAMKLNATDKAAVYKYVDDYVNMRYLTPEEAAKGAVRRPTEAEHAQMRKRNGVNERGKRVFERMVSDLDKFALDMLSVMREKVPSLGPRQMQKEMDRIAHLEQSVMNRPYFPITRFGLYTVLVQGPKGNAFYRTETQREQNKLFKQLNASKGVGEKVTVGKLPESSTPFQGLPVSMLDVIQKQFLQSAQKPDELRLALEQMKYESNPVRGATAKFANRALTPGYSQDFFRSYANFFFHGSRQLARMRYIDLLKGAATELRETQPFNENPVKRGEVSDYVERHFRGLMDPTTDWSIPRAALFHMILGFRVASAATNLTQTLISTIPHLASEFGDLKTMRATMKAATDVQNFYSRLKTLAQTGGEFTAMKEMMRLGIIRGAFAPELAGVSEGRNLLGGYGGEIGKTARQALTTYMKYSAMMFELSEQFNRRVAGMATYNLAVENPNAKFVRDAVKRDQGLYGELVAKEIPENQAAAIVAAKVMVDRTQGQYTKEYRPAYMKGPVGSTIFTFKLFTHQMVGNMWNHPAAGMRMLLIMGFMGGLAGIPGFADLNGILKAAGYWMFGKDWDLEKEAREFAVDVLGMKDGKGLFSDPFTITRGFASRGYGIPALLDTIGEWSGVGKLPIPELDRTAAVSFSNLLPVDFGAFGAQAQKDPGDAFAQGISRGMGALGSYAYNSYKAVMNVRESPDSLKRWERVAPTYLANMSHAARVYRQGAEVSQTGSKILRFDPHDVEHMTEVIAMGLGYTPFRLSKEWSRIRAEKEATAFWEVRKEILLHQFWSTIVTRDDEDKQRVLQSIRNFNKEIKETDARAMVITGETLEKSIQSRMGSKLKQEAGVPASESQIPIVRGVRRLFPGSEIDIRKER